MATTHVPRTHRWPARAGLLILVAALGACQLGAPAETSTPPPSPADTPPGPTAAVTPPAGPPGTAASPSPTPDPLAARTLAEINIPDGPDFPVEAFGSLWLVTPDSSAPSITRVDLETYEIVATIPTSTRLCQAIGATEDAIWGCSKAGLVRVDPATNEVIAEVEFSPARYFGYLPVGDGALWALGSDGGGLANQLVRVDPSANAVTATYPLGFHAEWLGYGADAVWLSDLRGGRLWRFDPSSEALTEHTTGLTEPAAGAFGADSIWLAVNAGEEGRQGPVETTLVRISQATGEILAELDTGGTLYEGFIYASDEAVWVRAASPFLTLIDPLGNEVVESIHLNMAGGSLTVAGGSLWVTSFDYDKVWRLRP